MQVLAAALTEDISITLVKEGDGWRFFSWASRGSMGGELASPPSDQALSMRFSTSREAMEHFRGLVARRQPISRAFVRRDLAS